LLHDYCGVDDVCLSVPAILARHGVSRILNIDLNEQEIEQFQHSANVLKEVMTQAEKEWESAN
jgi:L-lactate dehydrogenase